MLFRLSLFICIFSFLPLLSGKGKPLKVFILVGQSNMQGTARLTTLPHMAMDPKTKALHDKISNGGQYYSNDNVRIAAVSEGGKQSPQEKSGVLTVGYGSNLVKEDICGPELAFGITMYERLQEPILIIKAAWGGKSLFQDFRPPSAGEFTDAKDKSQTGHYYRWMSSHVKKVLSDPGKYHPAYNKEVGYEICGFAWFQGWNDMVSSAVYPDRFKPGGYDAYSEVLTHFIRDVRKEFKTSKMPFAIGVLGVDGPTKDYPKSKQRYQGIHQYFRDAMAAPASLPEFKRNVRTVLTENFWPVDVSNASDKKFEAAVQAKNEYLKAKKENKELPKNWLSNRRAELEAKTMTAEDIKIMEIGRSNHGFHYLGSLKCYSQIGEALANTLFEMNSK